MTTAATVGRRSHIIQNMPAIYLTLVSMIQAVALEAWVLRLSELGKLCTCG